MAQRGEILSLLEVAPLKANESLHFKRKFPGKNLSDLFKKLIGNLARRHNRDRLILSTEGEIGELDQPLGDMLEPKCEAQVKKKRMWL